MAKEDRINLRVSSQQKTLFANAAQARGVSVTEFILDASVRGANEALLDRNIFVLNPDAFDEVVLKLSDAAANRAKLEKIMEIPRPWED
jgi:uncharacterized protein (DUF1778 family)